MQFYARFQDEVIAEPSTVAAHVERARREVTPAFRKLFDEALVDAHEHLVANPSDVRSKARFVTIYHLILESTLGYHFRFSTEYLARGPSARLVEGYSHPPRRDPAHRLRRVVPARHVGGDPTAAETVRATLRELLPAVAEALGGADGSAPDLDRLGVDADEVRAFALDGLTRRLDIIGVPLASLA